MILGIGFTLMKLSSYYTVSTWFLKAKGEYLWYDFYKEGIEYQCDMSDEMEVGEYKGKE